jgi:hypothetical protein
MKYFKIIITPGPKMLPEEKDIYWGARNANEAFKESGTEHALFFAGLNNDGYAMLLGKFIDKPDLDIFTTEAVISDENFVNIFEITLDEAKRIISNSQKCFYYYSRASASRMLGEEFVQDDTGFDYDAEADE